MKNYKHIPTLLFLWMWYNCLKKQKQTRKTKKDLGLSLLLWVPGFFSFAIVHRVSPSSICKTYLSQCDTFSDSISCSWDKLIIDGRPSPITPTKHLGSIFFPDQLEIWVDALDFCSGVAPGTPSDETRHVFLITVTPVIFVTHSDE